MLLGLAHRVGVPVALQDIACAGLVQAGLGGGQKLGVARLLPARVAGAQGPPPTMDEPGPAD